MHVKIENGNLIVTIPVENPPAPSKSGKTLVLASTRGNQKTTLVFEGRPVTVGLNAYIPR